MDLLNSLTNEILKRRRIQNLLVSPLAQQAESGQRGPGALPLASMARKPALSGDPYRLDGSQNIGGARGDARLDGSQNALARPPLAAGLQPALAPGVNEAGIRGDARLDGSQNPVSPLAASSTPTPVAGQTSPLAAQQAPSSATPSIPGLLPGGGLDTEQIASRPGGVAAVSPETSNALHAAQVAAVDRGESLRDGGVIRGRGTGTSDSNVVRVSKGEAVLPADVVRAIGGKPAIDAMIQKHHKPVGGKYPNAYVDGGVIQRIDDDPTDWNKLTALAARGLLPGNPQVPNIRTDAPGGGYLVDQMDQAQQALSAGQTGRGLGIAARGALTSPLVAGYEALQRVGQESARALAPLASGVANFAGGFAGAPQQPLAAGSRPLAAPRMGGPLSTYTPNATAGQAQLRASDNALAALADEQYANRQIGPPAQPLVNYASPDNPGNGWEGRNAIRGGAEPSTLDQGNGISGVRGKFVSQGIGGTPGTQIKSDYGYGDVITATADKNGKFNSFSGVGGTGNQAVKPGIADLSSGLARAAANREQLAAIEAERNAIPLAQPMAITGQRGDARGTVAGRGDARLDGSQNAGGGGIGDPRLGIEIAKANAGIAADKAQARSISAGIVDNAAAAPYRQAARAAETGQAQAQTANTLQDVRGKQKMQPLAAEGQSIANQGAQLSLDQQKRMAALAGKAATSGDPKDHESYASFVRSSKGGGNLTPEDIAKGYFHYMEAWLKSPAAMDGKSQPMSFQELDSMVKGKQVPIQHNSRALSVQADLQAGKIGQQEAEKQLRALGYQ